VPLRRVRHVVHIHALDQLPEKVQVARQRHKSREPDQTAETVCGERGARVVEEFAPGSREGEEEDGEDGQAGC